MKKIEDYVLSIPDFPEPGIIFRDITSVLQDADGLQLAIDSMQDCLKDIDVDVIAGTESRGFIFGVPIAYNLHKPFVPIRKKGKLPRETVSVSYDLEYGSAEIEMHKDSIKPGQKVVIVDDLIATGGTIEAANADGLQLAIDSMQDCLKDIDVDVIAGTESRGFIFGVPIAYNLHKPFVPIRKKGKLPRETVSVSYDLEYGSAEIEMHKDSIKPGQKVVIVDDLIATGGTIEAAIKLVEQLGGEVVKVVFLMELAGLKGRERLNGYDVASVICYDGK